MSRDIRIGTILQSYGEPLTNCDCYVEEDHIQKICDDGSIVKTAEGHCNCTPDRCVVDCRGDRTKCSLHKARENAPVELREILKEFSDRIKTEFYYEFEELIPSIMADHLDSIREDLLKKYQDKKII